MYKIYFILTTVLMKQPHIAVLGVAITDVIAYKIITNSKTED